MKERTGAEHAKKAFSYQSWFVAATLIAVGLVVTIFHGYLTDHKFIESHGVAATLLGHLATAFLIAGLWHAIEVFLSRKEFIELVSKAVTTNIRRVEAQLHDVIDQIKASRHDRSLGFARSYVESHPELYEEIITDADQLTIVVNNGYVWVHTHRDDLKNRLRDPNKKTAFVLLNPGSSAASLMEQKENMAPGAYKARTDEALSLIAEAANNRSNVEVYGVSMSLGQAVFLTESKVMVVPRFYVEPSVPPVFVFEQIDHKKSYYRRIRDDVDHVLKHKETVRIPLPGFASTS